MNDKEMNNELQIKLNKLTGREKFSNGQSVNEFWSWAHSDLMNNAERGRLAEFIVSMALNCNSPSRVEWDAYDLLTDGGIKIEVKSSAYLQTWQQKEYSKIQFNIVPTQIWNEKTHKYSSEKIRRADVYVFCLFATKDSREANPLDLNQWEFYVVRTEDINRNLSQQKTLSLSTLKKLPYIKADFNNLSVTVKSMCLKRVEF